MTDASVGVREGCYPSFYADLTATPDEPGTSGAGWNRTNVFECGITVATFIHSTHHPQVNC